MVWFGSTIFSTNKETVRLSKYLIQFVIFKPISYCFEETKGFDVKGLVYKSSRVASNQVI